MTLNSYLAINLSVVWLDRDNLSASQGFSHRHLLSWGLPQVVKGIAPIQLVFVASRLACPRADLL